MVETPGLRRGAESDRKKLVETTVGAEVGVDGTVREPDGPDWDPCARCISGKHSKTDDREGSFEGYG